MPTPAFRVTDEFYEKIKNAAATKKTSVSDFIRSCVEQEIDNDRQVSNTVDPATIEIFHSQLKEKDKQIDQLHQIVAMGHQEREDLNRQLEDTRHRPSFWQRLLGKKKRSLSEGQAA